MEEPAAATVCVSDIYLSAVILPLELILPEAVTAPFNVIGVTPALPIEIGFVLSLPMINPFIPETATGWPFDIYSFTLIFLLELILP